MERKEIIIVTISLGNDGAERVLTELSKEWVRMGHKITVIQTDANRYGNEFELPNAVKKINLNKKFSGKIIAILEDAYHIAKILKRNPNACAISFLSVSSLSLGLASIFCKNKIIMSERNDPTRCPIGKGQQKFRDFAFEFADVCVFQTEMAKQYFNKRIQKKGVIIPNPINGSLPEIYKGNRDKRIVTACRLHPQKNLKMMIKAFSKLHMDFPEYKLVIYGQGILLDELQEYCHLLNLDNFVIFPGFCNNVISEMLSACMYISSSDYEGISNSMLEAMAIGLPTVVTDCPVGGARMMIKNNENGILVPVGDDEALYKAMKKIVTDNEFAQKLSINASKIREIIPLNTIADRWIELM